MTAQPKTVQPYKAPDLQPVATQEQAIMALVSRAATDPTFDVGKLEQLLKLQEQWQATQARKEYVAAMAAFKADPPKLVKNKHVRFQTSKGVTEYDHATHSEVTDKIVAALAKHGLSHCWNVEQSEGRIRVTCTITHVGGHSESVSMISAADDSGGKNALQALASATTYLQRYTLLAATGMSTSEMDAADTDGRDDRVQYITEKQIADLEAKISEVGANRERFLKYIKVDSIEDILAEKYRAAIAALEAKGKA